LPKGDHTKLRDFQKQCSDEYHDLTDAQKEEYVEELRNGRESHLHGANLTSCGRLKILYSTVQKIEKLYEYLKIMCGIDAVSLIVQNEATFHFNPMWFYTDQAIRGFLAMYKKGGMKRESGQWSRALYWHSAIFATSKLKAKQLKVQIQDKLHELLVAITKDSKAQMQYKNFERDIVVVHGIDIKGWTHPKWDSPSKLSTSLPPLQTLLDALNSGTCHFFCLSPEELTKRKAVYHCRVESGEVAPQKTRSDAGCARGKWAKKSKKPKQSKKSKKSKPAGGTGDDEGSSSSDLSKDDDEEDAPVSKRRRLAAPKSREFITESD
ncbi:hypothetical protein EVJ58_g10858, partial [Rhodofomes roseus]